MLDEPPLIVSMKGEGGGMGFFEAPADLHRWRILLFGDLAYS
jgi:hypothetical protein